MVEKSLVLRVSQHVKRLLPRKESLGRSATSDPPGPVLRGTEITFHVWIFLMDTIQGRLYPDSVDPADLVRAAVM